MFARLLSRSCVIAALLGFSGSASAAFHLWQISEIFSNANGTVQYIELTALSGGQQFVAGHTITSSQGGTPTSFTFPTNLPGDTTGKTFLIGTQGFAALGIVTPDYVVPNGFLFLTNGQLNFAEGSDSLNYPSLPTNGVLSRLRNGTTSLSSPKNFAGATAALNLDPASPDFNADNRPDLVWSNTSSGATYIWRMNGATLISETLLATIDPIWKVQGVGDFNLDGHPDVVWRHTGTGNTYVWYLVNGVFQSDAFLFSLPPEWVIQGVADFNADGKPDFLMRNTNSGNAFAWFFNNNVAAGDQFLFNIDPAWKVEGVGDVNADGQPDLLFRNVNSGLAFAWNTQYATGTLSLTASSAPIFSIDPAWEVVQVADWNGNGKPDLLFRNKDSGVVFVWYMDGTTLTTSDFIQQIAPVWEIVPRR